MAIFQRNETLVHKITFRNDSGTLVSPTTAKITITNPCGVVVVDAVDMTEESTGKYQYSYLIPADSKYGRYLISVSATDVIVSVFDDSFVVFSWQLLSRVRQISAINKESVDDDDLAEICMTTVDEVLSEIYSYHYHISPKCDPDISVLFDGTNKIVRTKHGNLADKDYDGVVQGKTDNVCSLDVTGYYIDSDYAKHDVYVSVTDSVIGKITVTKTDGTAIPSTNNGVFLTYWTEYESFNIEIMENAIAYLTAHHLILRLTDLHSATVADLPANQKKIEMNLRRFYYKYENLLERIRQPMFGGV